MNNSLISDIRKRQDELIVMINATFESIIKEVSQLNMTSSKKPSEYELIYPITNITGFKGTKVIACIMGNKRTITPTWKSVVKLILEDALQDDVMKKKLYDLRDKLLGRSRTRFSATSEDMRSPVKLTEDLYIETHYDTETLMRLLLNILDAISYDYSKINIAIKN